jgi:quercetin dioxygenase-like cupin family protein
MKPTFCRWAARAASLLAALPAAHAQNIRVLHFEDSKPFVMGKVTSRRIVHPDLGARLTTLNYSASEPGAEFSQHTHDQSDDTIVVLQGKMDLRQGDSRTPYTAGQCAFVPGGQIHGTITTAPGTIMISFQTPPDFALYTGARDSSKPGAAPPKGVVTPGAVKKVECLGKNGFFTNPAMGSQRAAGGHWTLKRAQAFKTEVAAGGEQVIFVWKGAIQVKDKSGEYKAGEKDAVFVAGPAQFSVSGDAAESEIIQIQAPPSKNQ